MGDYIYLEKIKNFLRKLGINEIIEKTEENIIFVPLELEFNPNHRLELTNRIEITKDGWIIIKCMLMFNYVIPPEPKIYRSLWKKLLQVNYHYPEITYSLDDDANIYAETDMPVDTTFENFQSEYRSIKQGALNYFNNILPTIDAEIKKVNTFERIHHLFLFDRKSGLLIYDEQYKKEDNIEPNLISGSLTVFSSLIQELTKEKSDIKIVEQENMTILLEHGNYLTGALFTEENFKTLRKKLNILISNVEDKYKLALKKNDGITSQYSGISKITEKLFGKPS